MTPPRNVKSKKSQGKVRRVSDKALLRIVKSFRHGLLGRKESDFMCMVVSAPLQGYLKYDFEIETRLVCGEVKVQTKLGRFMKVEHFWLELEDGRIIDPTRDQFGYEEKVFIGNKPDNYLEIADTIPSQGKRKR